MKIIRAAYPDRFNTKDITTVQVWYDALQDLNYSDVKRAAGAWIMSERWPPTIADIRAMSHNLKAAPDELAASAWDQLIRALGRAYAPDSREVWDSLPDHTRQIVGGYATFRAWGNTETAQLESVQRPMFVKRFENMQLQKRKQAAIPPTFRQPLPELTEQRPPAIPEKTAEAGARCEAPSRMMEELRRHLTGQPHKPGSENEREVTLV